MNPASPSLLQDYSLVSEEQQHQRPGGASPGPGTVYTAHQQPDPRFTEPGVQPHRGCGRGPHRGCAFGGTLPAWGRQLVLGLQVTLFSRA